MADFFEIDFLDVESDKSGDAITMRYELNGETFIHVVDGGYVSTGESVVKHIRKYYGDHPFIDHVVATHNDNDHAGGLREVLEEFDVGILWMLRPWIFAEELVHRFARYTNANSLRNRLRKCYPNLAELEDIANRRGIPILEPFQGERIGAFTVMAPTPERFLHLIVSSDKTPDQAKEYTFIEELLEAMVRERRAAEEPELVSAGWGDEFFPDDDTSAENEMSVVQFAFLNGERILLTADTGRDGLQEVIDYAPHIGLTLPGIDRFQVPHHGSRHNISTELLDKILGPRLRFRPEKTSFSAIVSSAKADKKHPRLAVLRAMYHRGAKVVTTEGRTIRTSRNAPSRGWGAATPSPYPTKQERA